MRHIRPGYTMLEMVATLSLVTVFLIMAGPLVTRVVTIQRDAVDMEWSISQMDFALRQLRQDVWTASAITPDGRGLSQDEASRLALEKHGDLRIIWSFEADPSHRFPERGWMNRQVIPTGMQESRDDEAMRYEVPHRLSFTQRPRAHGLVVEINEQPIWLPSQVMRARTAERSTDGGQP